MFSALPFKLGHRPARSGCANTRHRHSFAGGLGVQAHAGFCFPVPLRARVNSRTSFNSSSPSTSDMTRSAPALLTTGNREVHEFAFEGRTRERVFRVSFGNFHGLTQRLTVCKDNLYACTAPLGEFGAPCACRASGFDRVSNRPPFVFAGAGRERKDDLIFTLLRDDEPTNWLGWPRRRPSFHSRPTPGTSGI